MKRAGPFLIAVLLLWSLAPGAAEIVENVAHLASAGHMAHAAPDGDRHAPESPEHGCTGTVHLCSCCVSLSCLLTDASVETPEPSPSRLAGNPRAQRTAGASRGVYHPPRA